MKRVLYSVIALLLITQNVFSFGPDSSKSKPKSKKDKKEEARKWVYFEGDYVLGRLNANVDAVTIRTTSGVTQIEELKSLRHNFKSGFKVGFGVFFSKFVELHASWLRMQNNNLLVVNANGRSITSTTFDQFQPPAPPITNGYISTHLHDRTQTIDALIKSRRFFTHEKVSALPAVGLRGILMDRNYKQIANNQDISRVDTITSDINARLIGLILGIDLKYALARWFNFFGSVYTGAATGRYKNFIPITQVDSGTLASGTTIIEKKSEDFRRFFDATFGLSFNFNIGKSMNILFRIGAYIFYFDSLNFANSFRNNPGSTELTPTTNNTFQALTAGGRITF